MKNNGERLRNKFTNSNSDIYGERKNNNRKGIGIK